MYPIKAPTVNEIITTGVNGDTSYRSLIYTIYDTNIKCFIWTVDPKYYELSLKPEVFFSLLMHIDRMNMSPLHMSDILYEEKRFWFINRFIYVEAIPKSEVTLKVELNDDSDFQLADKFRIIDGDHVVEIFEDQYFMLQVDPTTFEDPGKELLLTKKPEKEGLLYINQDYYSNKFEGILDYYDLI